MDYETPGAGETYRRGRQLSDDTLALWREMLLELAPAVGVSWVCDVGCGVGRFSGWLAETYDARVLGLEPSSVMLSSAPANPRVRYVAGRAEALPVRAGRLHLAFLSLVYHHFPEPAAAVAELRRTLRPGGRVILRTPTLETLDCFTFTRFFPGARAIDERRLPARPALRATFEEGGLAERGHRVVEQRIARGPEEYCARIRARALSSLQLISDEEFGRGLLALEAYARTLAADHQFVEPVDVFVFQR